MSTLKSTAFQYSAANLGLNQDRQNFGFESCYFGEWCVCGGEVADNREWFK